MYIVAGKKRVAEVRATDLVELTKKAEASNLPEDAQAVKDLASYCDRFEKKLHDLELSRMVSLQTAPQLRLIQNDHAPPVFRQMNAAFPSDLFRNDHGLHLRPRGSL